MIIRILLLLWLSIGLFSCSSTNKLYYESLQILLRDNPNDITLEQVKQSQFDLLKVELNDRAPAVLVLTFLEQGLHKWGAGDGVILTLDGDRLTKTSGFQHDLLSTRAEVAAPKINQSLIPKHWTYTTDIEGIIYAQQVSSLWHKGTIKEATFFDRTIQVIPITQTLTMIDTTGLLDKRYDWTNTYWVSTELDDVVYSEQTLYPTGDTFKFTYLSRVMRLLEEQDKDSNHE